jgi:hypothetical protein
MRENQFYQESKSIQGVGLIIALGLSLAFTFITAYIYAILVAVNPIVYFTVIVCVGYGMALGLFTRLTTRIAKNRNKKIQYLVALFVGLTAFYLQWTVYIVYAFEMVAPSPSEYLQNFPFILNPSFIWDVMVEINSVGLWGIGEVPLNGFALTIIWILEFILIVALPLIAVYKTKVYPFSESLNKWFPKYTLNQMFEQVRGTSKLQEKLNEDVVQTIKNLASGRANQFSRIHLFYLKGDDHAYLSIEKIRINEKGNEVGYLILNNYTLDNKTGAEILSNFPNKRERISIF